MGKGRGGFRWVAMALSLCLMAGQSVAAEAVAAGEPEDEPIQAAADEPIYGDSLEPQQIIVTATRIPTPEGQVANSVSVFTRDTIEERQYRSLGDALKNVPGVSLYESGNRGSVTGVMIRGMDTRGTKVMLDGMPMNDPSQPTSTFDFGPFAFDNIAQMEVLRGPHSTLYGSAASGGVVTLGSQKGEGPLGGFFSSEAGSRGTILGRLGLSAGNDRGDFSLAGSLMRTDGISQSDRRLGRETDRDGHEQGNVSLRLGANAGDCLRFDLFAHLFRSETDIDHNFIGAVDDPSLKYKVDRDMIRPQATLSLFEGRWVQTAGFGYAETDRRGKSALDDSSRYRMRGETWKFDYQSLIELHETNTLAFGVDVVTEQYKKRDVAYGPNKTGTRKYDKVSTTGVFIEDRVNFRDALFATAGVRHEHHDDFGDKTTWNAGIMYVLPTNTKLKASAGTGFNAPSPDELFVDYSFPMWDYYYYANPNLKPETSFGWDVGFEQSFRDERVVFGSTFFRSKTKDKIELYSWGDPSNPWASYNQMRNIGLARAWGVESFFRFALTEDITLSAQHTWMRTENGDTRQVLLRRPKHEASVNVDWKFLEKGTFTAGVKYVGRRLDRVSGVNHWMGSYMTARVGAAWKFNQRLEVFGRVENLLNRKYQNIYGYGAEGLAAFAGATLSF